MTYPPQPGQPQQPGQPYYPPQPPQQPAKKKRKWPWIILAIIAVFVIIAVAGGGGEDGKSPTEALTGEPAGHDGPSTSIPPLVAAAPSGDSTEITYEVISDSGELNNVTWFDELNALQQESNVAAPWSKALSNTATFSMAGVTAQTTGTSVTCRVVVDGDIKEEKTSTGQYAVVNCSYAGF
ncbi:MULTISPECIES: MmpS family transport accessory protein [unclassified Rhodococcus (in: high G+C Gram-positive bacteria)]|uniref:MmpS family transport accessory protein n=1 Tax=unclassified Rhodococcus (in: high G+C Gram-positive bacteria) TaxID=192944 RepID=UPI00163B36F5|nr:MULTISPECIES: MmpS family transport accessory protein [unclassified Rhodococcus (in: high G+C Gram-positive bacteria)]MBC2644751.1 hypothetical protein [Rhodococcus sp. 3A]MBC2898346.1 hypothetical protein [Rhodococcus sp. 4CII]